MGRVLKFLVWTLGVIALLVVAAVVIVPLVVDPNDYKDRIAAEVEKRTGRALAIGGDIELSLLPWLGLSVADVSLANADGFDEPLFAAVERADVKIKLLPLLQRKLETDTVTLHGLQLNLARNDAGVGNWQDLAGPAPESDAAAAAAPPDAAAAPLNDLNIGGVDLQNAQIRWRDAQSGQRLQIADLALQTGVIRLGEPVALDLSGSVQTDELDAVIALTTTLTLDPAAQRYRADAVTLDADLGGAAVPGGRHDVRLAADASFDGAAQTFSVGGLQLAGLGVAVAGGLSGRGLDAEPSVDGRLTVDAFDPRRLLQTLGQTAPVTADPDALQSVSGTLSFSGLTPAAQTLDVDMQLDGTPLRGQISRAAGGRLGFDLRLGELDADRYLPPRTAGDKPPLNTPGSATAERAAAGQLPLQPLRELALRGQLGIDRLRINRLWLDAIELAVSAADGVVRLTPKARLYGGGYAGNIVLDATAELPLISIDETLGGVQAGPLLADLLGQDRISGAADAEARLTMRGADPETIQRTLNGAASFRFSDGAVKGINLGRLIREAKTRLGSGGFASAASDAEQTDFSELSASVRITDGVIDNDDLSAKSPLLRVTGYGSASLPQQRIDYALTVAVVDSGAGQGGEELHELQGIPIPVRITGSFAEPSFSLDLASILQQQTQQRVQQEADKLADKAKQKLQEKVGKELGDQLGDRAGKLLEDGAGEVLKGLFGN